jgi:hypothetical protein
MIRYTKRVLGGALLALSLAACSDFLSGEGIDTDPNNPTEATTNQLFVATQTAMIALQEGPVAQFSCTVIQHCGGVGNYVEAYAFAYEFDQDTFNPDWLGVYVGGGLIDLREIQRRTEEAGNLHYAGMAKVLEAIQVSFAADNWGDVPYSEALAEGNNAPAFDNQIDVYHALQDLLDEAIADLSSTASAQNSGPVPSDVDLIYGGDVDKWIEAAYTLKARLYVHEVEAYRVDPDVVNPLESAAAVQTTYLAAIDAAEQGISSRANDLTAPHTSATQERNLWFQFSLSTFGQYLKAGQTLIDVMSAADRTGDTRLSTNGGYFSDALPATAGDQLIGVDLFDDIPSNVSEIASSTTRVTDVFPQPLITYDETQLILAEAYFQTSQPGPALTALNNVRTFYNVPLATAATLTLTEIAEEQYVTYFQNVEAWQSYKRHCYPNLNNASETPEIPARLFYGSTEANTNPNAPSTAEQGERGGAGVGQPDAYPGRNRNDPPGGFVNPAAACFGLTEATPGS